MDTTLFLIQLWGPVFLALGVGFFTSRSYYVRVYRDLEKEPLALLAFSSILISAGVAQILVHNVWETPTQILVSLLAWGTLAKGVTFAVAPRFVDRMGNWQASSSFVPVIGALLVVLGGYLTYIGHFV